MTAKNDKAREKALEALIAASLRCPEGEPEVSEEEINRFVEQRVTVSPEDKAALAQTRNGLLQAVGKLLREEEQTDEDCVKGRHTQGIFYRRAAFDAYVVHALADDQNLGRTKIEKITHLTEYHCHINFEREPVRDAAGPVDYQSRRKVESLANKLSWYTVALAEHRMGVQYLPGPKLDQALPVAIRTLGSHKPEVDSLISLMRPLDTKSCEVVATLYAAWNDLLLRGRGPSDQEILNEATDEWHPKKRSIPESQWLRTLIWMRSNHLVPKGCGRPVPPPAA